MRIVVLALLGLLFWGCQPWPFGGQVNPTGAAPVVLFQDDFSNPSTGWDRVRTQDQVSDYESGVYQFVVTRPNWYYWARPRLSFDDLRLEVNATKVSEADLSAYGLICRYQDPANFYFFTITSDGFYGVSKFRAGGELLVEMQSMRASPAIRQGAASNHLRADCVGESLSFYVNGQLLASVQDADFARGDVGLIVNTLSGPAGEIHFDNLSVLSAMPVAEP